MIIFNKRQLYNFLFYISRNPIALKKKIQFFYEQQIKKTSSLLLHTAKLHYLYFLLDSKLLNFSNIPVHKTKQWNKQHILLIPDNMKHSIIEIKYKKYKKISIIFRHPDLRKRQNSLTECEWYLVNNGFLIGTGGLHSTTLLWNP